MIIIGPLCWKNWLGHLPEYTYACAFALDFVLPFVFASSPCSLWRGKVEFDQKSNRFCPFMMPKHETSRSGVAHAACRTFVKIWKTIYISIQNSCVTQLSITTSVQSDEWKLEVWVSKYTISSLCPSTLRGGWQWSPYLMWNWLQKRQSNA